MLGNIYLWQKCNGKDHARAVYAIILCSLQVPPLSRRYETPPIPVWLITVYGRSLQNCGAVFQAPVDQVAGGASHR